jgi:hypothetical protein
MTLTRPSKPLRCRLNIRHHWVFRSTEDGSRYMTCARCGKDRTGTTGSQALPTGGTLPGGM